MRNLIMIGLSLLLTSPARADCTTQVALCEQALGSCAHLVDAQKKEIGLCRLGLTQSLDNNAMLSIEIKDKQDQLQSWYRNPFVMVAVGLVLGGVAVGAAIK